MLEKKSIGCLNVIPSFKKCPYCGREIIVIDRNRQQIYCSQEHKKLYNSKNRKKTKVTICARCGKEFFQYSLQNSNYCSIECAARDREEAKRKKAEKKWWIPVRATGVELYQNTYTLPI